MSSTAWKDLERRICKALGANRRPSVGPDGYARGSDDDGTAPFSVETKRTTRYQLRSSWIAQARAHAKASKRPWLLVIAEHNDRHPIAVLDFWVFAQLAQQAGLIPSPLVVEENEGPPHQGRPFRRNTAT